MTTWKPSRPPGHERDPRPLAPALDSLARRLGTPAPAVLTSVFAGWEDLVGPAVAAHAAPRSLRDGVLVVTVDQPAWATQLRLLTAEILGRVAAGAGGPGAVTELRIQVRGEGRRDP